MLDYFDLFFLFYNLETKFFSVFGIRGEGHQSPLNAAITPDVQANENTAAKNFQISKF